MSLCSPFKSEMTLVKAIFCSIFLFQVFQAACAASAPSQVPPQPDKSPSGMTASTKCDNVHFNNYYSAPEKDIKAQLNRIENRLTEMQKKMDILTGKKPNSGG